MFSILSSIASYFKDYFDAKKLLRKAKELETRAENDRNLARRLNEEMLRYKLDAVGDAAAADMFLQQATNLYRAVTNIYREHGHPSVEALEKEGVKHAQSSIPSWVWHQHQTQAGLGELKFEVPQRESKFKMSKISFTHGNTMQKISLAMRGVSVIVDAARVVYFFKTEDIIKLTINAAYLTSILTGYGSVAILLTAGQVGYQIYNEDSTQSIAEIIIPNAITIASSYFLKSSNIVNLVQFSAETYTICSKLQSLYDDVALEHIYSQTSGDIPSWEVGIVG